MNIAFFYLGQQGGGAALDTLEMAVGLSHYAKVLCVVSSTSDSFHRWINESERNQSLNVIGLKTSKRPLKALLGLINVPVNYNMINKINEFKPDVIYSHMGHPYESVLIPFVKSKIKARGIHDVKIHEGEMTLYQRFASLFFRYRATHYVVFSDFSFKEMIKNGVQSDKILTTFLGCNTMLLKDRNLDVTHYNRFLFFGRLIKYKGIDVLFHSLESVFKEFPTSKLVIAGRGDISAYATLVEKFRNNLDIYNEWIDDNDVPHFFKDIDFVVAPYTNATQSGVVLLSYSFGKPVIVSDSGGLPEQVNEGVTGLVVPTGNSDALSEAIIKMLKYKEHLSEMKKCAFDKSMELTWEAAAKKLYEQFDIVLKN